MFINLLLKLADFKKVDLLKIVVRKPFSLRH
jgi:hypothetical protein